MSKKTLEERIVEVLTTADNRQLSTWQIANALWDNCMAESRPGNGGRCASITKACWKSDKLDIINRQVFLLRERNNEIK